MLNELKNVKIDELSQEEIDSHTQKVLSLNEDDINEYLIFVIDNFYKSGSANNTTVTNNFIRKPEFRNYLQNIYNNSNK